MYIVLVEDDLLLGEGLKTALLAKDYSVNWLSQGKFALEVLKREEVDALIIDLGLPDIDGIELIKKIRQQGVTAPILILTARDQIEDKLAGLNSGADDYLVKPFDIRELEARLRVLIRRLNGRVNDTIEIGQLVIAPSDHSVRWQNQPLSLSRREFQVLHNMAEQPGRIFSREKLEQDAYGWDGDVESNAIEVHIHNLRKKLGKSAIKTVRGVGYMLNREGLS